MSAMYSSIVKTCEDIEKSKITNKFFTLHAIYVWTKVLFIKDILVGIRSDNAILYYYHYN